MNKIMITGANGQLGRALQKLYPDAVCVDRETFDISNWDNFANYNWREFDLILNAAAYTNVDEAETDQGRRDCWKANATAVRNLAKIANQHNITLVHVSSEYVFDGQTEIHTENEDFAPLGVYAQTKAAAEEIVSVLDKYYTLRISWAIGEGNNFVKVMQSLAEKGVQPKVVNDQVGRLTFMEELARAIKHLVDTNADFGTYNFSSEGESVSWAEIAKEVFELSGKSRDDVTGISTEEYFANADKKISPRPHFSTMDIAKIKATGFTPADWRESLRKHLEEKS